MANAIYPLWLESLLQAGASSALTGTVTATLVDLADYTYSAAHEFIDDVPAAARVASEALGSKTYAAGVFDAADTTFSAVTGDPCEALVVWIDTGVGGSSRLVAYYDSGVTGLPVTPNGGDVTVVWNASGILKI